MRKFLYRWKGIAFNLIEYANHSQNINFGCKFLVITLLISGFSINDSAAQVLAPDFICVKNDTLIWAPANNPCGAFQSYDIFFAEMEEGPYSILAQITDPLQTDFFHNNPADLPFFYYLESNYDCAGQNVLQSDTLDNRSPDIPVIESLSTIGNTVEIKWELSTSPETEAYIILRLTPSGAIPIDTVFNGLTFLDLTANPQAQDETYFVLALDPCGNNSLFGEPQSTYRLNAEVAQCLQEIRISWTPTSNFERGIATQEIWLGENGDTPTRVGAVGSTDTFYNVPNIEDGVEYCFFVKAISNIDAFEVNSNTLCITPSIINPVNEFYISNLDFQNNDEIDVSWIWNDNAAIESGIINGRRIDDGSIVQNPIALNFPISTNNTQTFNATNAGLFQWEFQVISTDLCDSTNTSDFARPIFLSTSSSGGLGNTSFWTPLEVSSAEVQNYEIIRTINGNDEILGVVDFSTLEFTDNLEISQVTSGEICYTIRANSILTLQDGTEEEIISHSNQTCRSVSARIFMPTAFSPRGINRVLKPIVSFGTPQEFRMLIYNRYGQLVFESNDIELGWDGRMNGRVAPQDVYTYTIRMIQQDGSVDELNGFAMLVL